MQHGTITIPFAELRARAFERPEGYFEDVIASGTVVGESVQLSLAAHRRLVAKFQGSKPAEEWPLWALLAGLWFRQPGDLGVGDTIARELGGVGSESFKRHHELLFGIWVKPCGCAGQVASWNALYRYGGED